MRDAVVLSAVLLAIVGSQVRPAEKKPDPKSPAAVMIGCVAGNTLVVKAHGVGPAATYALRGSKERMQTIHTEFDHQMVEIAGHVSTSLALDVESVKKTGGPCR